MFLDGVVVDVGGGTFVPVAVLVTVAMGRRRKDLCHCCCHRLAIRYRRSCWLVVKRQPAILILHQSSS